MNRRSLGGLLFGAGTAAAAAAIGSVGSYRAPVVYEKLDKPDWAPAAKVFGPVWTALYAAVGVAGSRLWTRRAGPEVLSLHTYQLALNAAWPFAFFVARNRHASLAVISALDTAIGMEIAAAVRRDPPAAALLAPYLGWSLFATALTISVSSSLSEVDDR